MRCLLVSMVSATIMLKKLCLHVHTLYTGEDACSMNVHSLKHLARNVQNWGPLWAYSCFPFESFNGHIKRRFHGTRCMNHQVCGLITTMSLSFCVIDILLPLCVACFFVLTMSATSAEGGRKQVLVSSIKLVLCCTLNINFIFTVVAGLDCLTALPLADCTLQCLMIV